MNSSSLYTVELTNEIASCRVAGAPSDLIGGERPGEHLELSVRDDRQTDVSQERVKLRNTW